MNAEGDDDLLVGRAVALLEQEAKATRHARIIPSLYVHSSKTDSDWVESEVCIAMMRWIASKINMTVDSKAYRRNIFPACVSFSTRRLARSPFAQDRWTTQRKPVTKKTTT